MAFTTGFTQAQLTQLEKTIALGVGGIDHMGKKTTFQSLDAMLKLRDRMKAELAQAANTGAPPCMTRPTFFCR